jgi:hypothetical protein
MSGSSKALVKRVLHRLYGWPGLARLVPERVWERADVRDPVLRLLRERNLGGVAVPRDGEKRVLFLRMRFVPRLGVTELVLAKQLADDGATPVFAYCSPVLPACNGWDLRSDDPRTVCERCDRNNRALAALSPFPSVFLERYLTAEDRTAAAAFARDLRVADLRDLTVEDVGLGNEMYLSLAKFLFRGNVPETPENLRLARGFAEAAFLLVRGLRRMFDDVDPDVVVMNCGHVMWYGVAYAMLRQRGVRVAAFDETNIAVTRLTWDFDDASPSVDYAWDAEWLRRRGEPLTPKQRAEIVALTADRREHFLYVRSSDTVDPRTLHDFSAFDRVFTLFTNVPWDATIVGKDIVFDSMLEWVEATVEEVERHPECALVIRVHPAEAGVHGMVSRDRVAAQLHEWRPDLPPNVFIIDAEQRVDSYDLIDLSAGVLAYCSNVGLEALLSDKPTIVAGAAHYRGKQLASDVDTPEAYRAALREWLRGHLPDVDVEAALRYAYLAWIDTQIDLGLFVEEHPYAVTGLRVADFSQPLEGRAAEAFGKLSAWLLGEHERGPFTNRRFPAEECERRREVSA